VRLAAAATVARKQRVNASTNPITKIFYLVLASLTLLAAAVQWLPKEGFPPDIDLGPREARGQSPAPSSIGAPSVMVPAGMSPPGAAMNGSYSASPYGATAVFPAPPTPAGASSPAPWMQPATPNGAATAMPYPAGPTIAAPPQSIAFTTAPVEPSSQELESTRVMARVGGEVILAGEVISSVNGFLARNGVDPHSPEIAEQKKEYVKMRLKQLIETRIIVNEARRKIPAEGYKRAMEKFDEEFNKNIAPKMAEERKLPDIAALEEQLKRDGTTLEREKRNFAEQILSSSWISQNVQVTQDVPHAELLAYYHAHAADYEISEQVRWEQLTMRFEMFSSKAEAFDALARAGNQVVDGRRFADVARELSQGTTASKGGLQPWTKRGSLVSKKLEDALFALQPNTLSPIIEDDTAFHIVRVIERVEAGRVPFTEAQVEIRKKIGEQRTEAAKKELVENIRRQTQVWTIYDERESGTASNADPNRYR